MSSKLQRVKVIRNRKFRDSYRGYYDHVIKIRGIAESYIFIGSGNQYFYVDPEDLEEIDFSADFEHLLEQVKKIRVELLEDIPPFMEEKYVIPGTSLKGAVRSRAEFMFKSVNGEVPACYIVYDPATSLNQSHLRVWGGVVLEVRSKCETNISSSVCEICDIFGSSGLLAKVSFGNLVPISDDYIETVEILGRPYVVFKPGAIFEGEIRYGGLETYQLGLLLSAMRIPEKKPILIGEFKYKKMDLGGKKAYFGRLRIEVKDTKPSDINIDEAIREFKERFKMYFRDDLDETAW